MTRGAGTGSNAMVRHETYAAPRGHTSGLSRWLSSLLPWWGWLVVAALLMPSLAGVVVGFFEGIVSQGGHLIGLGAVALMVVGVVWAILGLLLRMIPHGETKSNGHHMVRHGAIAGVVGMAIMLGGLSVAWGVGSVLVHDVMAGVRARVNLPDAPDSLKVQWPNLTAATPAPPASPRP